MFGAQVKLEGAVIAYDELGEALFAPRRWAAIRYPYRIRNLASHVAALRVVHWHQALVAEMRRLYAR